LGWQRAKDLKAQAGGPIENPKEMASNHKLVVEVITSIPAYKKEFKLALGSDKVDIDGITTAISEFEKTLITPNSRLPMESLNKHVCFLPTLKNPNLNLWCIYLSYGRIFR